MLVLMSAQHSHDKRHKHKLDLVFFHLNVPHRSEKQQARDFPQPRLVNSLSIVVFCPTERREPRLLRT
jgi:hypothetical protein